MRADIFVHPDFTRLNVGHGPATNWVKRYEDRLKTIVAQSELAILVHDVIGKGSNSPDRGEFWDMFEEEKRVMTSYGGGNLSSLAQCNKFWRIIEQDMPDRILIHGSYLHACVSAFTGNLANALSAGDAAKLKEPGRFFDVGVLSSQETEVNFGTVMDNHDHTVYLSNRSLLIGDEHEVHSPRGITYPAPR